MVPCAKKNLHQCEHHLKMMNSSTCVEDLEIHFAAFVMSARCITWILQKEFKNHKNYKDKFLKWYGDPNSYSAGHWMKKQEKENEKTKLYEMTHDDLCQFFYNLRNNIEKEGINGFICNTRIKKFNSATDLLDRPLNSHIIITGKGIYYLINKGTGQEDLIPAKSKGHVETAVFIDNPPNIHLGKYIPDWEKNILDLSKKYYEYLKNLVEEWTSIINSSL